MYALEPDTIAAVTDLRVRGEVGLADLAGPRPRRAVPAPDGRLVILAADHPARMVTAVGDDPIRMGDRADYLGRIVRILRSGHVDGLMGTPDIIEEALAVDLISCERGEESFLAEKLLIGCMNRGGLAGTTFEMDDTFTAFTAAQIAAMNLDGAKMMFRLELLEYASGRTIAACSRAVNDCIDHDLTVFLEALMVRFDEGKYEVDASTEAMVRLCGVAAGLGKSSWKTWLKVPYCVDFSRVAAATTCPLLMLGGPATGDPEGLFAQLRAGMAAGPSVRGALVGRNVLYPGEADPADAAAEVWHIVHEGA